MNIGQHNFAGGPNGDFSQQITDDHKNSLLYEDGYRGRDLQIGPQVRVNLPHGGLAFKYYRDTLVQNRQAAGPNSPDVDVDARNVLHG